MPYDMDEVEAEVKRHNDKDGNGKGYCYYTASSNWLNGFGAWETAPTKKDAVTKLAESLERDIKHLKATKKAVLKLLK